MGWQDAPIVGGTSGQAPKWASAPVVGDSSREQRIAALKASNPAEYDPTSPEWQAKYGPTAGMSGVDKFMAGAGKSVVDVGRGVAQLFGADNQAAIDEAKRLDAPLMDTGAGLAGNVGGTLATTLLPASALAKGAQALNMTRAAATANAFANPMTYKAAALAGAAQGGLQPVASDESRAVNMAVGAGAGLGGQALVRGVSKGAQPVKNMLTAAQKKAVDTLESAGVPLDLAQMTGSKTAQAAKRVLADNPIVGDGGFADTQRAAYNKAVLKTIGEDASAATPEVMARAQQRIGGVMNDIAERNPIKYDGQFETQLAQVVSDARKVLEDSQFGVIKRQADEILNKAADGNDLIDGKAYQNIKQQLDEISMGADQSKGKYARDLREALDQALERSASKEDYAALKFARAQYRRMKQIEGAIENGESGHISPAKLANKLGEKRNAAQSKYGKGDQALVKLAKAGKEVLPDKLGNSGTTARAAAQLLGPGAIAAGASLYHDGDMSNALKYGMAVAGAPWLARGVLQSPRVSQYLAKGLGNPTARELLTAPQEQMLLAAPLKHGGINTALQFNQGLGMLNAPQEY